MLNQLLRYFYKKNSNIGHTRNVVIKNYNSCSNLLECFNMCKSELV
jgi:hypothetical protein